MNSQLSSHPDADTMPNALDRLLSMFHHSPPPPPPPTALALHELLHALLQTHPKLMAMATLLCALLLAYLERVLRELREPPKDEGKIDQRGDLVLDLASVPPTPSVATVFATEPQSLVAATVLTAEQQASVVNFWDLCATATLEPFAKSASKPAEPDVPADVVVLELRASCYIEPDFVQLRILPAAAPAAAPDSVEEVIGNYVEDAFVQGVRMAQMY